MEGIKHGSVASLLVRVLAVAASRERLEEGGATASPPAPCRRGLPEGFLPVTEAAAGLADDEDEPPVRSMWKYTCVLRCFVKPAMRTGHQRAWTPRNPKTIVATRRNRRMPSG